MAKRFEVWVEGWEGNEYVRWCLGRFRSFKAARGLADRVSLRDHRFHYTRYNRASHEVVVGREARGGGESVVFYEAPGRLVPTVGEVGYW